MADFDTSLKYGSRGAKVSEVQEFLIDQGFMTGEPTGNFYSITLRAVKTFQTVNGISPVSGFWGPLTRAAAQSILDGELAQSNAEASTTPVVSPAPIQQQPVNEAIVPQQTQQSVAPTQPSAPQAQAVPQPFSLAVVSIGYYLNNIDAKHSVAPPGTTIATASDGQFAAIGVIPYYADGSIATDAVVTASTTDPTQNGTLKKWQTFCYFQGGGNGPGPHDGTSACLPYTYLFLTPGTHTVEFDWGSVSQTITMTAK